MIQHEVVAFTGDSSEEIIVTLIEWDETEGEGIVRLEDGTVKPVIWSYDGDEHLLVVD